MSNKILNIKLYLIYSWQLCATLEPIQATIIFMIHAKVSLITRVPQFCKCENVWNLIHRNTIYYKWVFKQAVSIQRVLKVEGSPLVSSVERPAARGAPPAI